MKKHLQLIILIALSFNVSAQSVNFESSYQTAKSLSSKTQKPLFIYIAVTLPPSVTHYSDGFLNADLIKNLNKNFISYKVNQADTNALQFIKTYHIYGFPAILAFDAKGGLLLM